MGIEETKIVLEKVENIQEKGVAGAYDGQFSEIERYLNNARNVLDDNREMTDLADFMEDIESQTVQGQTRLTDIRNSFRSISDNNDDQKKALLGINANIEAYRDELKDLNAKLDRVEGKDPIILWQRIEEAVKNATKYEILAKQAVGLHNNAD